MTFSQLQYLLALSLSQVTAHLQRNEKQFMQLHNIDASKD